MKTVEECKKSIQGFIENSIVKCPSEKIKNIGTDESKRDENFCIFIMTFGRPNRMKTWRTLMEYDGVSLNQDTYLICSDDDKQLDLYIEKFGDRVLVFNKKSMVPFLDKADCFENYKVILYARNICFAFAKKLGYRYFLELDDDYDKFSFRPIYGSPEQIKKGLNVTPYMLIKDYDRLFKIHLDFLKTVPVKTITLSQHGDYIGGANPSVMKGWKRKVMNSFFCDVEDPFMFDGTINEDVNYYVQSGNIGILNFNLYGFALNQETTQAASGGMTDQYLEGGTYLKTFYSLIFCPGSVGVSKIGHGKNARIHHRVRGENSYVKILDQKYSKSSHAELNSEDW